MKPKRFIEKFFTFSEVSSLILKAIAGVGTLLFTGYGFWAYLGDTHPKFVEGIKSFTGLDTKTPKIIAVLAKLGYKTDASRAFVIRYVSDGDRLYSDFTKRWQWVESGLTPIPYTLYPVWDGLSLERYHKHSVGKCVRYITTAMGSDKLTDSFRRSGTIAHFSCGAAQPTSESKRGTLAIAVEFSEENTTDWSGMDKTTRELKQSEIEIELIAAGGAIAEILDR